MTESPNTLRVDVRDLEPATMVVVEGEIDIASAERLTRAGGNLPARGVPVVLDLQGVTFIDSSGMRSLLDLARVVQEAGRPLALLRPSAAVTRLLDLVDLRHRFAEVSDIDSESLAALISA